MSASHAIAPERVAAPPGPDGAALRDALGRFATGVAVVTARGLDGRGVGVTINSFSSVSLDPPLVAWNLSQRARSLTHFMAARTVAIHVLADGQEGIARRFAASPAERFAGLDVGIGPGGVPLLKAVLARFICTPHARYPAGDHVLFVMRVEVWQRSPGEPLVFYGSRYRHLQLP